MISALIERQKELTGAVNPGHMIADVSNMLIGGILTSAHMIASTMMLLQQNPDQLRRVKADHSLIRTALEEGIRLESPVQWQPRLVLKDTEIAGVLIPADSIVLAMYGSANRDPLKFENADRFEVDRPDAIDHLGYGLGIHFCVGAPLARLEGKIAMERLLTRLPNLRPTEGRNDWQAIDSLSFRGPREVHLTFDRT